MSWNPPSQVRNVAADAGLRTAWLYTQTSGTGWPSGPISRSFTVHPPQRDVDLHGAGARPGIASDEGVRVHAQAAAVSFVELRVTGHLELVILAGCLDR